VIVTSSKSDEILTTAPLTPKKRRKKNKKILRSMIIQLPNESAYPTTRNFPAQQRIAFLSIFFVIP